MIKTKYTSPRNSTDSSLNSSRKQAEEALPAEHNMLLSLMDAMDYTVTIQDPEYNIIYQNEPSRIASGGDHRGEKCYRAYEGRETVCDGCPVEEAFKDDKSHTAERRTVISGEVAFWENTANPIRDARGKIVSCLELARDITEHKQREQALADEATRRRLLVDQSLDGIVVLDVDAKVVEANQRFADMLGYTLEEVRELHTWDWDKKFPPEKILEMGRSIDEKGLHLETKHHRKDGSVIDVDISISAAMFGGQKLIFCVCRDVTERKQMEEALKEREERYRELANSITDVFFAMDEHLRYTYWNRASEILTGIRAEDAIGKSLREIFPDMPWRRRAEKVYRKVLRTQQPQTFVNDYDIDDRHYLFEISAYPSRGGIAVFVRDITESKQAEEKLQESEQKYRLLFETSLDCIAQIDREGRYLTANPATAKSLGVPLEELNGKPVSKVVPKEVAQLRLGIVRKALDEWQPQIFEDERAGRYFHHIVIPTKIAGQKEVVQVITRDVTERRKMEEALRQSEEKHKALFDSSVIGMFVMDAETMKIGMCNQAAAKMFGFSSVEEAIGINPVDFIIPEDKEKALEIAIKEMFEQDLRRTHEYRVVNKDGIEGWISVTGARIMHEGRLAGLVSITDITERKQAVEALRQSEERYRTILEEMEDSYFEVDLGGHLTFANSSTCRNLGYSREEMIGMSYKNFTAEDDIESVFRVFNEVHQTGVPNKGFPWKIIRKDGSYGFVEASVSLLQDDKGEIIGFRGVGRDITERKQAEEKLRQSEENYKILFNSSVIGMYVLDVETMKVVMGNRAAAEMAGFSSVGNGIGINPLDFVIPEDREQVLEIATKEFEQNLRPTHEVRVIAKDGGIGWISISSARIMHKGKLAALVSFTDITEHKQAEEALRQSEENYRVLFDSTVIGTIVLDAETMKIAMVNQAAAKMFGFSSAEKARGADPFDFVRPEDKEIISKIAAENLFEQDSRQTYELGVVTKDGREIWINATGASIMHEGKLAGLISFTDITEQKRQSERLMVTDRLASLGELAAGTAHELNNPLTSIIGFSQLLMEKETPDDIREDLKLINNEAQRAVKVTRDLLTFARKHAPVKQHNQINSIIEDVLELRGHEHKVNHIDVERHLAPDLPEIMVDYFQMQQVLLNIIINAEYFMTQAHNKGTLTITTKKQNSSVVISIADDGPGILPENLRRIFDPFFTTKEAGNGTGLGLSICHGIVTEHGGQIYIRSQLGKGATVFVDLPIKSRAHIKSML